MLFRDLATEALVKLRPESRRTWRGLGFERVVHLFGDLNPEEISRVLVDRKLVGCGLSKLTVRNYRATVFRVLEYGVRAGYLKKNPIALRGYMYQEGFRALVRPEAIRLKKEWTDVQLGEETRKTHKEELEAAMKILPESALQLAKIREQLAEIKRQDRPSQVKRKVVEFLRTIACDELADLVREVCGLRKSSWRDRRHERTEKAYESAVVYVARHPEAPDREVGKHCGVHKRLVEGWRENGSFDEAVKRKRGELSAEEKLFRAQSRERKSIAQKQSKSDPTVRQQMSDASKKRFRGKKGKKRRRFLRRKAREWWQNKENRQKGLERLELVHNDPKVHKKISDKAAARFDVSAVDGKQRKAAEAAHKKASNAAKKRWKRQGYRAHQKKAWEKRKVAMQGRKAKDLGEPDGMAAD